MKKIKKILIANRGEIVIRIARTAREMGLKTVGVFSEEDYDSEHTNRVDECFSLGAGPLAETYLNSKKLIDIAKLTGCQAVHPGYGFLSENYLFAKNCIESGLIFIGPAPETIKLMGNKLAAREFVKNTGVPVTPGLEGTQEELSKKIKEIGFPVLIKAAAGGGGKGMRIAHKQDEFINHLETCSREAQNYFGDSTVYIEKYLESPRHIEVQILGDQQGNIVHLHERECSIQRRYQKIIEEAPAPGLDAKVRKSIHESALKIAKAAGYYSAGTIEFLLDKNGNYYFLEMNTRIQVEHPVTEKITGVDIVKEQIKIADGGKLEFTQAGIVANGHAIECRIYAEDPENNFQPSPGRITFYKDPDLINLRVDSSINKPVEVKSQYDPMISKLISFGADRKEAIANMKAGLADYKIFGIKTNLSFLDTILSLDDFASVNYSTKYCEENYKSIITQLNNRKTDEATDEILEAAILFSLDNSKMKNSIWQGIGYWRGVSRMPVKFRDEIRLIGVVKKGLNKFQLKLENNEQEVLVQKSEKGLIEYSAGGNKIKCWVQEYKPGNFYVSYSINIFEISREDILNCTEENNSGAEILTDNVVRSSLPGKIIKVCVKQGDAVKKGTELIVIEAMKMENSIYSTMNAKVKEIKVKAEQQIEGNIELIILE